MKRSFVEPQMKVMAVNMKENIAASANVDPYEYLTVYTTNGNSGKTSGTYSVKRKKADHMVVDTYSDASVYDGEKYKNAIPNWPSTCYTKQ